jgi:uncharacterized RmlC-like cupin family protein
MMKQLFRTSAAMAALAGLATWSQTSQAQAPAPATPPILEKPLAWAATNPALKWGPCPPGMPEGCAIAVLHGDPSRPNADIFLRIPGGSTIPPHSHSSAERMILVSGELEVKYQKARQTTLRVADYAYGPAGLPHRATCRSEAACVLFIAFEGPIDLHPFEGSLD